MGAKKKPARPRFQAAGFAGAVEKDPFLLLRQAYLLRAPRMGGIFAPKGGPKTAQPLGGLFDDGAESSMPW